MESQLLFGLGHAENVDDLNDDLSTMPKLVLPPAEPNIPKDMQEIKSFICEVSDEVREMRMELKSLRESIEQMQRSITLNQLTLEALLQRH